MKRVLFIAILNLVLVASGLAQSYVIDILYGPDSVACVPVIPEGKKFKNKEEATVAKQKVYLHSGDAVRVTSLPADSLRLRDFMKNNGVEITFDGKKYTTSARNIILSDTTGVAVDAVNGMLKNKPCLFELDIHGRHRYLFNYGIIVAMLVIGLFGAFLTIKTGRIGFIFLIVPLLYFTWFTLHFGWDSYWFIDPMAVNHRAKAYGVFALAAFFAVFAVKAVWTLYDDNRNTEHRLGLIAAPFLLPLLYISVWGGLMALWALLLIIGIGGGFLMELVNPSEHLKSYEEKEKERNKERNRKEHDEYMKKQWEDQRKSIERRNKENGLY
jgi:hypothetical protein